MKTKHSPLCTHDEDKCNLCKYAPELLEACKATLIAIQGSDDMLESKIKQAIAKAEGK